MNNNVKMIPKGSVIHEWRDPYLIVPILDTGTDIDTARKPGRKRRRISASSSSAEEDRSMDLVCRQFPRWKGCLVFDRFNDKATNSHQLSPSPPPSKFCDDNPRLQSFLRNIHSRVLSTEDIDIQRDVDNSDASTTGVAFIDRAVFREISILTFLKVIEMDRSRSSSKDLTKKILRLRASTTDGVDKDAYGDEDDDDDDVLLIELWPLIQQYISWDNCRYLFRVVKSNLHVVAMPHPLKAYAQETLFRLDQQEFEKVWMILWDHFRTKNCQQSSINLKHHDDASIFAGNVTGNDRRHYASQRLLDKVADFPTRWVGILLQDPTLLTNDPVNGCTSSNAETVVNASALKQSCLPETCLELTISGTSDDDGLSKQPTVGTNSTISCCLIALYDIYCDAESPKCQFILASQAKRRWCPCFRCRYEANEQKINFQIAPEDVFDAQQLAHCYFQNQDLEKAREVYQHCFPLLETSTKAKADCLHSMAAVLLAQYKFAQAQRLWKDNECFESVHKQIAVQCKKQTAYHYFQRLDERTSKCLALPAYDRITSLATYRSNLITPSASSHSIFLAHSVINPSFCNKLIQWAHDHAKRNNGWTTSRHYAVPTTDVPIHEVPLILEWFQGFMTETLFPLLLDQFKVTRTEKRNRFYVHDAFLVRYEGCSSNNFLPLHYDESTHSCVIALNNEACTSERSDCYTSKTTPSAIPSYSGGGTFFYDLQQSVNAPKGGMVSFRGNHCLHGGNPVLSGTRYIIAIFLYLDEDITAPIEEDRVSQEDQTFTFGFF